MWNKTSATIFFLNTGIFLKDDKEGSVYVFYFKKCINYSPTRAVILNGTFNISRLLVDSKVTFGGQPL